MFEGHRFARVIARRGDLRFPLPDRFAERLTGRRVEKLARRAKYILAHLDKGETLIMHLGMSGRFLIDRDKPGRPAHAAAPPGKHDHIMFETDAGARVTFTDHRRFGMMDIFKSSDEGSYRFLADLGPEPLSKGFSAGYLDETLANKKTPIKSALLDQHVVAGLGNIYVCEALFRAGISPKRLARNVAGVRAQALVPEIKLVLREAIKAGGSTLRDYKKTSGELGYFQTRFRVYDREGEPCLRSGCGGKVVRIVQSGRSTYYCPQCQT